MPTASQSFTLTVAPAPQLLAPSDFAYLGAFRLQEIWQNAYRTLEYSNAPLALLPSGRLLVGGHVYESKCMEFTIPASFGTGAVNTLPTAPQAGPWRVIKPAGAVGQLMSMVAAGDGFLYCQWSSDYDNYDTPASTLSRVNASTLTGVSARWGVAGKSPWVVGRQITARGTDLYVGRHRGAQGGEGPNWFRVPQGTSGSPAAVGAEYSGWTGEPGGDPEGKGYGKEFVPSDAAQDMSWVEAGGRRALVMSGLKDYDPARWYYGYEGGVLPSQCEPHGTCRGQRGHRAGDARPSLLLWDPDSLIGSATPHNRRYWYAKVDLSPYFRRAYGRYFLTTGADAEGFCSAYDPANRRLYVSESFADGARPIVHAFRVGGP